MATAVADPYTTLERKVTRRLRDHESHRRVSAALAEVAVAAVYPARSHGAGERAMRGLFEDPVASATRVAVETLIDELEDLIDSLPPDAIDHLATNQVVADLGLE